MDPDQKIIHAILQKQLKNLHGEKMNHVLIETLKLQPREMISFVGAGGKTTLMFRLARELVLDGKRVVTTTTTKIMEPSVEEAGSLFIDPNEVKIKDCICSSLKTCKQITVAHERMGSGKLRGISSEGIDRLWELDEIDMLLAEADGAAGRTVKAPREQEPVIPSSSTLVIGVLGVDGSGMVLNEENTFQAEQISQITGIAVGERLTDEALAVLATHPQGILKGIPASARAAIFLNKTDLPDGMAKGKQIAWKIVEKRHPQIGSILLGHLKMESPVAEVVFCR